MYKDFYGFLTYPFDETSDSQFLYPSDTYKDCLSCLLHGLQRGYGVLVMTGAIGTGKTFLLHTLLQHLDETTHAALLVSSTFNALEILQYAAKEFRLEFTAGCSSATTLIMKWLEFGGQELSKCPDMIGQSSGHSGGSVAPLGLDQSRGVWFLVRQRSTPTHMRPGEVVEGLKEHHASPHLGAILTEARALAH